MISADHLNTAMAVAVDAGILDKNVLDPTFPDRHRVAIDAAQFKQEVGGLVTTTNDDNEEIKIPGDMPAFKQYMDTLLVIARATPEDKLLIVSGLENMDRCGGDVKSKKVAVVGEGMNDVQAFKASTVSLAMGSGASLAKNNASMVLTANEFESCV